MANSIARANVLISANADAVPGVLSKTGNDLKKWSDKTGKDSGGGFSSMLAGGLKGAGPLLLASVGVAGVMGGKELASSVVEGIGDIGKQGVIAKAMGIDPSAFTGIAGVAKSAGEDTREFIESLVTMGKLGTDAAKGTEQAADAFKTMGLNANDFIKLSADEQFYKIFEAINKIQDPLSRTRVLMQAFGEDGGKYLLPLLAKTPEELRKMGKEFALTGEQIKTASEASASINKLKASFNKMWQNLAVTAAPFVQFLTDTFMKAIEMAQPFFDWMKRGWETIKTIAEMVWGAIGDAANDAWAWIKENASGVFDLFGQLPTISETVIAFFRGMGIAAALTWDTIKTGAGIVAWTAGNIVKGFAVVVHAFEEVVNLMKDLPEDIKPPGLNEFIKGVSDFKKDVFETGEGMEKWGTDAMMSWGKSAEQFNAWLDKGLNKTKTMAEDGKVLAATASDPTGKMKLAEALLPSSKEAYSLLVKNQYRDIMGDKDNAKATRKATEGTKKNTDVINKNMAVVADKLKNVGDF